MTKTETNKTFGLSLRPKFTNEYIDILGGLLNWLGRRGNKVLIKDKHEDGLKNLPAKTLKNVSFVNEKDFYRNSGMIISMGGDGTLLGTCRQSPSGGPPIFGINMGRLGFITEFSKLNFYEDLEKAIKGQLEIEKIPLYQVTVKNRGAVRFESHFINDAVISKNDISRMFVLSCEVEQEHVYDIAGDGVIISSPIGSTAYSLAAGGPIIHPDVKSIVLTPICPHSLNHRPLVIPHNDEISLRIRSPEEKTLLTIDGQQAYEIHRGDQIIIRHNSRRSVSLIKNPERTFFHTLKEKFTHGRR